MRQAADLGSTARPAVTLAERWEALHDQANELTRLAQLSPEPFAGVLAAFPAVMKSASEWRRNLADQGLDDIEAMMRPGLSALATLQERGAATNAPALALWREFYTARGAVMEIATR